MTTTDTTHDIDPAPAEPVDPSELTPLNGCFWSVAQLDGEDML